MDITTNHASRHSEDEFSEQLLMLIDSGAGVVHVRTHEVLRATSCIRRTLLLDKQGYSEWDIVNGVRKFTIANHNDEATPGDNNSDIGTAFAEPLGVLRDGGTRDNAQAFVFVNPQVFMPDNPHMTQLLLMYNEHLPALRACVILVTPDAPLPESAASDSILSLHFHPPGLRELRTSLTALVDDVKGTFPSQLKMTEDDLDRICFAGAGMTRLQFETYVSLGSIREERREAESLGAEALAREVQVGKTDIVNSSDILELYPKTDINEVGGMENLKEWINKRKRCYSDEAAEAGVEPPKGLVLVGPPGCLHENTSLLYKRGVRNSGRPITIKELYEKFNGLPSSSRGWENLHEPTYLHSVTDEGRVFYNRILAVLDSGERPIVRVVLDNGTELLATPDHPVLSAEWEFIQAGHLSPGDEVLLKGSMLPTAQGGRNLQARPPRVVVNVKNHPHGSAKLVQSGEFFYSYKRVARARLAVEAHMNQMGLDEFIQVLDGRSSGLRGLRFLPPEMEVHHIDEDTMNDSLGNLMVLHKVEHAREHSKLENFGTEYTTSAVVLSVTDAGTAHTYDIQMAAPANNFAANGIFVHNTGKSLVAKAVAGVFGVPLIRLDFGRVFSSYVGSSEQRVRSALRMIESMAPCVLMVDEIDKGLGGIGGGGSDSGVSMRVLGSFLTWLNDCKAPVFSMVTANNIDGLPPELLRRGRFDGIFSTALPSAQERQDIFDIHLRKRKHSLEEFTEEETELIVNASERYIPAELESAVRDALVDSFSEGQELGHQHILKALSEMVPLSKSFAAQLDRMSQWAANNATPVSLTDAQRREQVAASRNRTRVSSRRRG